MVTMFVPVGLLEQIVCVGIKAKVKILYLFFEYSI